MKRKALWAAVPYTVPVMLGYLFSRRSVRRPDRRKRFFRPLGVPHEYVYLRRFDAVCRHQPDDLCIFSGFRFLLTLMVNARHLFYGLSMLKPFERMGKRKPYMIFFPDR